MSDYESLSDDEADILENETPEHPATELPTKGSSKKILTTPCTKRKRSKVWKTFNLVIGADKVSRAVCMKFGYICVYDSKKRN